MNKITKYKSKMKKNILTLILLPLLLILVTLAFSNYVYAQDETLSNITLSKNEVINNDYFAAGNTVNVSGTINGDAYIAGGNVTFDGVVNGDLITAGGNVTILGKVTGDVRAAGGNVIFSSEVDRNATILGGSVSMSDAGKVTGSLVAAGGNLSVNSPVGKGANIAGAQITLGNTIGGNVNAYISNLALTPDAKIAGDLNYWSGEESRINPEASVSGKTNYHFVETGDYGDEKAKEIADSGKVAGLVAGGALMFYLYCLIVSMFIGLLLIKLLPVFTVETIKTLEARPFPSLGIGFLAVILFPATFIVLLVTVIGIPLAFALLIAMILLWFISQTFIALFVGSKLLKYFRKEESSNGWSLFTGLLVLGFLSLIPVINFFAGTLTYLFGIGALLIQKKNTYSLLRAKKLI